MKLTVICICILFGLASSGSVLAGKKGGGGGGGKAAHAGGGGGHGAHAGGAGGHGGNAFHGAGASGQHNARSSSHTGGQGAHAGNGAAGHHGLNSHNRAAGHGLNGNGHGGVAGNHNGLHNGNAAHHGNAFHNGNNRFARNGHWNTAHWRNSHAVFANYHRAWHDHYWWGSHYNVVEVGGGWGPWYWDGGYWFPAWGYNPAFTYGCDCPVYAYANLPPDQVVVNVQEALQDQGYYAGNIDGQLGQQTRDALGQYQKEHNLEPTLAIDEPTVQSLGLNTEQA